MVPHPFDPLTIEETNIVRDVIIGSLPKDCVAKFRNTHLLEPAKEDMVGFLAIEHRDEVTSATPRPTRLAQVEYAIFTKESNRIEREAIVDVEKRIMIKSTTVEFPFHASVSVWEADDMVAIVNSSQAFQKRIREYKLANHFEVVVEPWPYGGQSNVDDKSRYLQALVFACDKNSGNPDSNYYSFPLPIIVVVDMDRKEVCRLEELATSNDLLSAKKHADDVIGHCRPSEYVPELLPDGVRKDLKELNVVQPDGPSFSVNGSLVKWQKWSFRVAFNPREGAVLHDVCYDNRSVLYRLSMSEMTVPYADPRAPFYRKQAFDFGDGCLGNAVNNLRLGCDCLGVIKYFNGVLTGQDGSGQVTDSVICMHEQDNGVGWKHTNWRTNRAVVVRRRELVIQFMITLANYEYIFLYIFDQAGGITVEIRATGILSVVNIDPSEHSSPWGNIVSPGALAQNHQHLFSVRIDPAIDGHENTLVQTDSLPLKADPKTNPHGNLYEVRDSMIQTSTSLDLAPQNSRVFKIQNRDKTNPITGKPISYKLSIPATQMLLADLDHVQAKRATFAQHPLWVTEHRDGEFYAGGKYPMLSSVETGGIGDAAKRADQVVQKDIVLWCTLGLTHNPRIEDWPVMPVEILQLHLTPYDFFTSNPAIDVPSTRNTSSRRVPNVEVSEEFQVESCCRNQSNI